MAKMNFKIEGMRELQKSLKKLGETPQRHVTASSRKGMNIVLKAAKGNAPEDTGALIKGTVMKGERSKRKSKKVYRIVFDRAMNDIFQKKNAEGKVIAYYPISQEYGYFTVNGRYIPGYSFTRKAMNSQSGAMSKTIVQTMKQKIDEEIAKGGLK